MNYIDAVSNAAEIVGLQAEEVGDMYEKQVEDDLVDTLDDFAQYLRRFAAGKISAEKFRQRLNEI